MIIRNGLVFTEEGEFKEAEIRVEGARFASVTDEENGENGTGEEIIDASGCYVIPGFTDIHLHGCMGQDFCYGTVESIETMTKYEASVGVTAICPTSMTIPEKDLLQIAKTAGDYCDEVEQGKRENSQHALFAGINMEGPFIAPEKKGAQALENIQLPDAAFVEQMMENSGYRIRLVDIAPEQEGSLELIRKFAWEDWVKEDRNGVADGKLASLATAGMNVHKENVPGSISAACRIPQGKAVISIAHTTADYDTASAATQAGAHHVTHLYNAMPAYTHRAPGVVGAASDDPKCMVELISDGQHIHPSVIRNTFRMFGEDRVILISDSMEATGMPDGDYQLGGQRVIKVGNSARLADGTLAGSATNLADCFRFAVQKAGIPIASAIKAAAVNPAKSIGMYDELGSISAGKLANCILLDRETLELRSVILRGELLF